MSDFIFEWRPVHVYNVPLTSATPLLRPERAILRFSNNTAIDIGAMCYLVRKKPSSSENLFTRAKGRQVVLQSLNSDRVERVRAFIEHISTEVEVGGRRIETIRTGIGRFMDFMGWADEEGRYDVLDNGTAAYDTLKHYVAFVRDRVSRNEISLNSGARQQIVVRTILEDYLEIEDFGRDLFLLKVDPSTKKGTVPPCEVLQGKILALASCLFESLASLTVDKLPYPHAIPMPEYIGFSKNLMWVFPGTSWFKSPSMIAAGADWNHGNNYVEGRLATFDEVKSVLTITRPEFVVQKAKQRLNVANAAPHHPSRCQAAQTAMGVYQIMFVASTAMNWAQVIGLKWSSTYEVESSRQGFRTIKWRAGGKLVSFELAVGALAAFRRFLEVRKYLLRDGDFEYLFFSMDTTKAESARQITGRLHAVFHTLKRIDPSLLGVHPRQWRAAKSDWLIKNTDISTTALVLQNTERTVLASYAEGSETQHVEDFSAFFDQMSNAVVATEKALTSATDLPLGKCISFREPKAIPGLEVPAPKCDGVEGCLGCDKFKLHADERDTRKLLSCRHCLRRSAFLLDNHEHERSVLKPLLDRIEQILSQLKTINEKMVNRLIFEVDEEGDLDAYWAGKLEMLMELGIFV